MADLVYGFASSHGPLLSMTPDTWELRSNVDRVRMHQFRGSTLSFDEMLALRRSSYLIRQNEMDSRIADYQRSQRALDVLADRFAEVKPDVLVLVGDDQEEWFDASNQPAISVLCGESVVNRQYDASEYVEATGMDLAARGWRPPQDEIYPIEQDLAQHIIAQAIEDEFDVSVSARSPMDDKGPLCITHSVGFIVRRIMRDRPIPIVPILQNTFWAPNRPKPGRSVAFGKSVSRAIRSWGGGNADKRVAICASGGLSHYVVDEEWDRRMLNAMVMADEQAMRDEPDEMFRSGTSETKNWFAVACAAAHAGLKMTVVDYVPCYRTEAGTGSGMGFATWE